MIVYYPNRTEGIIIKKDDRGEADRIFTIFTKDFGKLEILGKGIRKIKSKLRGSIELFYLSEIEFIQGKIYKTLTDATLIENFPNLRKNLERLKIVQDISEILDDLIGGEEKDEKIWQLLKETLKRLNNFSLSDKEIWLIYYCFFWNFLALLGYKPQLNSCLICRKKIPPKNLYFNSKEGGLICQNCSKKLKVGDKISPNVVKILRLIFEKKFDFLKKIKIKKSYWKEIEEISKNYLNFIKRNLDL